MSDEKMRAPWDDPDVQLVYALICGQDEYPPEGEHWDGHIARRIVAELRQASRTVQSEVKHVVRVSWGGHGYNRMLHGLQSVPEGTLLYTTPPNAEVEQSEAKTVAFRDEGDEQLKERINVEQPAYEAFLKSRPVRYEGHEFSAGFWAAWSYLKAATPAPVKPADQYCQTCGGSGDVHTIDGEWRGECPACKDAPIGAGDAEPWQTIETAPEGANGFAWMSLAWGPDHNRSTGNGFRWGERYFVAATFYCLGREKRFEFREIEVKPTHWMETRRLPEDIALLAKRGGA